MADVAAFLLGAEDVHCFALTDPTGALRVVFEHKACERLAHDEAHVKREAGILSDGAAGTFQDHYMVRILEHNVASHGVGNRLLQVAQVHVFLDGDELGRSLEWHDLAVIAVSKGQAGVIIPPGEQPAQQARRWPQNAGQRVLSGANTNVEVRPTGIDVAMQPVKEGIAWRAPGLLGKGPGRGPD
jgi:hypothetical protein